MIRKFQWMFSVVPAVFLTSAASAQSALDIMDAANNAPYLANQSNGGFGLEYAQPPTSGSVMMDQYGMLHDLPYVPSEVPAASSVAATPVRPVVTTRASRSAASKPVRQPRYRVTTGSLGAPAGSGVILYSPALRGAAYGYGYDRGPYGVTDYGYMWKGWPTD